MNRSIKLIEEAYGDMYGLNPDEGRSAGKSYFVVSYELTGSDGPGEIYATVATDRYKLNQLIIKCIKWVNEQNGEAAPPAQMNKMGDGVYMITPGDGEGPGTAVDIVDNLKWDEYVEEWWPDIAGDDDAWNWKSDSQ